MLKLSIKIANDKLLFSECKKDVSQIDINNTNVYNNRLIVFDENYIKKNYNLIASYIKVILAKNKVKQAAILNLNISHLALTIINSINSIETLYINPNKEINFETYELLNKNKYLKYINCYSMPRYMFEKLNSKKNFTIDLRSEIIWFSSFMDNNNLSTYSNIYYKKKITINNELNQEDVKDMNTFFSINNNLTIIDVYKFSLNNINILYKILSDNNIKNIQINIYQDNTNLKLINENINTLKKIQSKLLKNKINIKIIYSEEYKEKNFLKQINISFLKILAIIIIIVVTIGYITTKYITNKNNKKIEEINKDLIEIEKPVEETPVEQPEQEIEQPQENTTLTQNFEQLLAINNETIGWLKVNNTKIDYPVVQHNDNDYYLNKDFYHNNNINGWIYMDYRNSINNFSDNTIIYGHTNYTNYNLMLGSLIDTLKETWYTNPSNHYITFNTLNGNYKFKIFSIYTIGVTSDYLVSDFKSEINHQNFINTIINRSIYNFNTPVTINDKILTLSTCYNKGNERLVVHAKLVN